MPIAIQREYKMHVFHGTSERNIRIEYNSYHVGNYISPNMFRPGHRCGQMHHYTCTLLPATSKAAFDIGTTPLNKTSDVSQDTQPGCSWLRFGPSYIPKH